MDLSRTSVFLDFDGTVTTADTGVHLLERLADGDWRALDDQYAAGLLGSRELLARQWAMLPSDETLLRATAREVPLDPGFEGLVAALRDAGAEVMVVSDGFGLRAFEVCQSAGVDLLTNAVDFSTGTLEFPNLDRCCPCGSCGTCKQAPVRDAARRGRHSVFVGDGASDRKAALLAERLFAKEGLAQWCELAGVAFESFEDLDEVRRALLSDA